VKYCTACHEIKVLKNLISYTPVPACLPDFNRKYLDLFGPYLVAKPVCRENVVVLSRST